MEGSIPLSTLRCKVEYGFAEAATPQGNIGIKVWVNQGDYLTGETDRRCRPDAPSGSSRDGRKAVRIAASSSDGVRTMPQMPSG